jgi:hypothetical protein
MSTQITWVSFDADRYAQITRRGKENRTGFRAGCQSQCEKLSPMPQSALKSRFAVFSERL